MLFKCKMCGGDIFAEAGAAFGTCDSCGTTSTLPKVNEERIVNLFNRANHFRRLNEFDKAMATYENILTEDSTSAEAHWGIVLCRYGIEYVQDPKTHERVPTCHRAQYEPILSDADYLAALENAPDGYARGLYEEEAKKISEIQRSILAISSQEEPFDIFICYKETTDGGSRTKDSTLAQDIYYQLTNDGYKVFFSRITLEDRLGRDYEPYIFSALNSAKVMLVVGTKREYFDAVWVKNEWSRFLALMKKDRSRLLIPCYRDMDAYDMPDELSHLQSQDMGKIGFVQDLLRGVKKVLGKDESQQTAAAVTTGAPIAAGVESLMKRGFLYLEDSDWKQAAEYFDRVLDIDPESAKAYIGQLLVEYKITSEDLLVNCDEGLEKNPLYQRALRFADENYKKTLSGYVETIRKNKLVNEAINKAINKATTLQGLAQAIIILEGIRGFKNADVLLEEYKNTQLDTYSKAKGLLDDGKYETAIGLFKQLGNFQDAPAQAQHADMLMADKQLQDTYANAVSFLEQCDYEKASDIFKQLGNFQDAAAQAQHADSLLNAERERIALLKWNKREKNKKIAFIIASLMATCIAVIIVIVLGVNAAAQRANAAAQRALATTRESLDPFTYLIAAGGNHTVGRRTDRTVVAIGSNSDGQLNVGDWQDIIAIAASTWHTVGLRIDGAIVAVGWNNHGQLDVGDWRDIVAIAAGGAHTVGLRADGTVVAVGNNRDGQLNVSDWRGIVAIAAGRYRTIGLRADGTVVAVGNNRDGQLNVGDWRDIVAIVAGALHTVGLRADGTVVAVGNNDFGQLNVGNWRDIVAIAAGTSHTIGLSADGTVVAVGNNTYGQLNVGGWRLFD